MKFKVGDRVLCKKSLLDIYKNNYLPFKDFNRGEYYEIIETENNYIAVNNINKESWAFVSVPKIDEEIYTIYDPLFEDHFYTKEEMRKLKLDKINEI